MESRTLVLSERREKRQQCKIGLGRIRRPPFLYGSPPVGFLSLNKLKVSAGLVSWDRTHRHVQQERRDYIEATNAPMLYEHRGQGAS